MRTVTDAASTAIGGPTGYPDGTMWTAIFQQDGVGGRKITWAPGIFFASTSLGDAAANSYAVFHFVQYGGDWFQAGQQTTDLR